jgi:hypothetical protein
VRKLPLAPLAVFNLVRELRKTTSQRKPLALAGARSLVEALRRELVRDGDPSAVRDATPETIRTAAALVYVSTAPVRRSFGVVLSVTALDATPYTASCMNT